MAYYDAAILYADEDKKVAGELVRQLRDLGFSLWWDEDLTAHEQFSMTQMISVFIRSEQVLALWSENALKSNWVRQALELARKLDKRTVHCLIGSATEAIMALPTDLSDLFIDLRSDAEVIDSVGIRKLVAALMSRVLFEGALERQLLPRRTAPIIWAGFILAGITTSLIISLLSYPGRQLPDLPTLSVGRISPINIIYSGLILCAIGALMSGARQILELVAAWRIMKKLRAPSQRETPTKPQPA